MGVGDRVLVMRVLDQTLDQRLHFTRVHICSADANTRKERPATRNPGTLPGQLLEAPVALVALLLQGRLERIVRVADLLRVAAGHACPTRSWLGGGFQRGIFRWVETHERSRLGA